MIKKIILLGVCLLAVCVTACFEPPERGDRQPSDASISFWIAKMKGVDPDSLSAEQREQKDKALTVAWNKLVDAGRHAARQIKRELNATPDDAYFQLSASMVLYQIEGAAAHPAILDALGRASLGDNGFQYFYLCHRLARSREKGILPVLEGLLANETVTVFIDKDTPVLTPKDIPIYLYGVFGRDSIPALKKACASANPTVRANATAVLGYFGDDGPLPVLARLLNSDPDENVRSAAANALGQTDNLTVASYLAEVLTKDKSPNVRAACAYALGELQHEKCVDGLAVALNDFSPQVRQYAASSLEHIGTERCADVLARRLAIEKDKAVRLLLVKALGLMGQKKWVPLLREALEKGASEEADAARLAIKRIIGGAPRSREAYPDLAGEEVSPAALKTVLISLSRNNGERIDEHKKTIFLSADASHLGRLEELRCRVLWIVNDQTIDRLGEVSKLIRLVRRNSRDML